MRKSAPLFTLLFFLGTLPLLSGCGSSAQQAGPPAGPAESMQNLMQGIADENLVELWNFFPASYQQQWNDQTREFAAKVDPELYNGIFNTAQRITSLLKDKKEFILKNQMIQGLPVPQERLSEFWDPTVGILATIANGEVSSVEKLKDFNAKTYLNSEGNIVLKKVFQISEMIPKKEGELNFRERIKQTKVTLISEEGDTAKIKIEAPGEEPREQVMIKVEDKWIPDKLQSLWKRQLDQSRQEIAEITPESMQASKQKVMPVLKGINEQLAILENAKTEAEFNQKLTPIIMPVAMLGPMLQAQLGGAAMGTPMGSPMAESPGEAKPINPNTMISIVVNKKLTPGEQDPIIDEILQSANDTESLQVIPTVDGEITTFKVYPVEDIEAFSKKIKFGKPSKVDPDSRSITVELE
ncbi:hypothetical protein FYZ48_15125 [Gimesia chilikensis]|uniref:hypothetical protein n=1 Tax=Gimesia chilikensis TaxID=2605989 RepID=UPI0011EE9B3F|nr:hypothetical protein [Gimesia chilikensis]KAA0137312.1 hypothetical protein FYZ48_15125 [Gimesia chilikensis]